MNNIYISGRITGTTDYMERFSKAEKDLRNRGYIVFNPAKVNAQLPYTAMSHDDYMKVSFLLLNMCEAIFMMSSWKFSKGAKMEFWRAYQLGMEIIFEDDEKIEEAVQSIMDDPYIIRETCRIVGA